MIFSKDCLWYSISSCFYAIIFSASFNFSKVSSRSVYKLSTPSFFYFSNDLIASWSNCSLSKFVLISSFSHNNIPYCSVFCLIYALAWSKASDCLENASYISSWLPFYDCNSSSSLWIFSKSCYTCNSLSVALCFANYISFNA